METNLASECTDKAWFSNTRSIKRRLFLPRDKINFKKRHRCCCESKMFSVAAGVLFISTVVTVVRALPPQNDQQDKFLQRPSVDENSVPRPPFLQQLSETGILNKTDEGTFSTMDFTVNISTMCYKNVSATSSALVDDITAIFANKSQPIRHLSISATSTNNSLNSWDEPARRLTTKTIQDDIDDDSTTLKNVCRVYMAPSTIPGAGYGLFAGISFQSGDLVTPGDGVVPIHNPVFHNGNLEHDDTFLWDEYVWSASTFTAMEISDQDLDAASFGIGALPNCYFALLNVEDSASHGRDNANLESVNSPGLGAFTPWYDRKSHATQNIHVGSELFVDYGYAYFESRIETFGHVPFLDDYEHADRLLHKMINLTASKNDNVTSTTMSELSEDIFQLSRTILNAWPNRVFLALPENSTTVPNVLLNGGTMKKDYLRSIRNIDYLKTHGACMDHMYVASSKVVPHAGRGVFTSRYFVKGSIVTTVPLIHIPDRKVMITYDASTFQYGYIPDELIRNETNPIHQQLLLNYCFGHKQSTLLLCPYGIVSSLINHAPIVATDIKNESRQPNAANVQIQWSTKITKNPEWWNMNVTEWAHLYRAGLAFEYIALRDIDVNEEIFFDYGLDWQSAWDNHVAKWQHVQRLVDVLNADIDSVIPTSKEWVWHSGDINLNPKAVNLWCYDVYRTFQGLAATDEEAYPCRVVHRLYDHNMNSYMYTAVIIEQRQNEDDVICDEVLDEVLWSLRRDAFAYGGHNEIHDTNQYLLPTTFRHEIGIPDLLMPSIWKNEIGSKHTPI